MPETKKVNPTGTVKAAQPRQQEAAAGKKSLDNAGEPEEEGEEPEEGEDDAEDV